MINSLASIRSSHRWRTWTRAMVGLGLLIASLPAIVEAQVAVAPTALFLTGQERFGGLYISNSSDAPQEVSVEFRFGYPAADSTGAVAMQYADSAREARYSLAPYVRAFPQRFILPPGETQVVRLTAEPVGNPDAGLYWTRIVTTSSPQVEFQANDDVQGIETRVQFRLQQVTALFFRKGDPSVQIHLGPMEAALDSSAVALTVPIEHDGNSPLFGTARIRVLNDDRGVVAEQEQAIAIYVSERRRYNVALPALEPGEYTIEFTVSSERNDLPQDQLTEIDPATAQVQLTVPDTP